MKNDEPIRIIIAGDTVPTSTNITMFSEGDIEGLFGEDCIKLFRSADFRIINLETPLTYEKKSIKKYGPALQSNPNAINAIKKLGIDLVTLANNHIMDMGVNGLTETIFTLDNAGIMHIGAGNNLTEARKPYVLKKGNISVGFYSCCENEFSVAEENKAGANGLSFATLSEDIQELNSRCDFVIVIYHGGKEEYRYPTPNEQIICRTMLNNGANIVLAQHSHCIGCCENYNNKYILYGQGNFIFDLCDDDNWKSGLITQIEIINNNLYIEQIPTVKQDNRIRLASISERKNIMHDFTDRSIECMNDMFVKNKYSEYAKETMYEYLYFLGGRITSNKYFRFIDTKLNHRLMQIIYGEQTALALLNFSRCESHREMIIQVLSEYLKK